MPNIRESDVGPLALHPTEVGVDARAGAARRIGALYNQVGGATQELGSETDRALSNVGNKVGGGIKAAGDAYVDYEFHQEASHGAKTYAELHSDLTDQWDKFQQDNPDPNDASIQGKFRETVLEPALDKFREGFNTERGQQFAESHIDSLRNHFFEKTQADMIQRAGDAVKVNVRQTTNAWTNTARRDPSSVPFLMKTAESSIDAIISSSPTIKGATASRIKNEVLQEAKENIVKAGALGAIEKSADPEKAALTFAQRWPEYVNGQEIDQLGKAGRSYQRMNQEGERAAQADARRKATAAFHNDANKWELSTIDDSGNLVLPPDAVKNLKEMATKYGENADPPRINAMVHRVQELGRTLDETATVNLNKRSDATERELYARMQLPDGDPNKLSKPDDIHNAYTKDNLTWSARDRLLKNYTDDKSPQGVTLANDRKEFFKSFASSIDPGRDPETGAGASPIGSQKLYQAQQDARRQEAQFGHEVYDPRSPHYFGKPENLAKYRYTLAEKAAYAAQLKADQAAKPSSNLGTITGVEVRDIPPGMSPAEALKKFGPGKFRLPDGGTATLK